MQLTRTNAWLKIWFVSISSERLSDLYDHLKGELLQHAKKIISHCWFWSLCLYRIYQLLKLIMYSISRNILIRLSIPNHPISSSVPNPGPSGPASRLRDFPLEAPCGAVNASEVVVSNLKVRPPNLRTTSRSNMLPTYLEVTYQPRKRYDVFRIFSESRWVTQKAQRFTTTRNDVDSIFRPQRTKFISPTC